MIFDSDEQRKAVFANLNYRGKSRYAIYRGSSASYPKRKIMRESEQETISRLRSEIKVLKNDRGDLQRYINGLVIRHKSRSILTRNRDELANLDAKINAKTEKINEIQKHHSH